MEMYCMLDYIIQESMKSQCKAEDLTWKAIGIRH